MVRAGPSVAAAGSRVTVRVVCGGLEGLTAGDLADPGKVNVWIIDETGSACSHAVRATEGENGTVIPARVVEFDPTNAGRYLGLEVEMDLGPDMEPGVYGVAVLAGGVAVDMTDSTIPSGKQGVWDWENTPGAGHHALLMERAMNVLKIEYYDKLDVPLAYLESVSGGVLDKLAREGASYDGVQFRVKVEDATEQGETVEATMRTYDAEEAWAVKDEQTVAFTRGYGHVYASPWVLVFSGSIETSTRYHFESQGFVLMPSSGSGTRYKGIEKRKDVDPVQLTASVQALRGYFGEVSDGAEVTPGAPVRLNDDNDDKNHYDAQYPPPEGKRICEPAWDLEEAIQSKDEDDLLRVELSVRRAWATGVEITGDVTLRITEGADRIRLWPGADKGPETDVITVPDAGKTYPVEDLPLEMYLEGMQTGKAVLTLTGTAGGKDYTDTLVINVVALRIRQEVEVGDQKVDMRRIIYEYNEFIYFEVEGGTDDYRYEWNLDGKLPRGDGKYEKDTGRTDRVRYGPEEGSETVRLEPTAANRRRTYPISVNLTGGLVLWEQIRVALAEHKGTPMPSQDNAGLRSVRNFTNNVPISFDDTGASGQKYYEDRYGISETEEVDEGHRIQYASTLNVWHQIKGLPEVWALAAFALSGGSAADMKIFFVAVPPEPWDKGLDREELRAILDHEACHLTKHLDKIRKKMVGGVDVNANTIYRRLLGHMTYDELEGSFLEAEAYVQTLVAIVDWLWLLGWQDNPGTLAKFANFYKVAVDSLAKIPAGADHDDARDHLRGIYETIPFEEMKTPGYDHYVRPPE